MSPLAAGSLPWPTYASPCPETMPPHDFSYGSKIFFRNRKIKDKPRGRIAYFGEKKRVRFFLEIQRVGSACKQCVSERGSERGF